MKEQQNGSDYLFEDGTASIPGHAWISNEKTADWVK